MSRHDGFTLLEVIAALVIMSAVFAAGAPLMLDAHRVLAAPPAEAAVDDLAAVADRVVASPASFGWTAEPAPQQIAWPGRAELGAITVRRLGDGDSDQTWYCFRWRDLAVFRWVPPRESGR